MNWKLKVLAAGVGLLVSTAVQAENVNVKGTHVHDTYKDVINRQPYNVEVCYDKQVSGDKTGDTLSGAILGGLVGHNESNATGGSRTVCQIETRYKDTNRRIYSHSTIVFVHEGTEYRVRFQK